MVGLPTPRRLWFVLLLCGALAAAGFLYLSQNKSHFSLRVYRIGYHSDPPYQIVKPEGGVEGLSVDIVAEAAHRLPIRIQWVYAPEGPDVAIRSNRVDLWTLMADRPERHSYLHITAPWLSSEHGLVSNGPLPRNFSRSAIACAHIPANVLQLAELYPQAQVVVKPSQADAVQAVCSGEALAAFTNLQTFSLVLLRRPPGCEKTVFQLTGLRNASIVMGIGSSFASAGVADDLRNVMGDFARDGTFDVLFAKWGLFSSSEAQSAFQLAEARRRSTFLTYGAGILAVVLLVVIRQIRRVREAHRAAEAANSAKSQFLATMSHEIRTPLNGVVGMTELLAGTSLTDEQREMVTLIEGSAETLLLVVNDVLDFSKIEAGSMRFENTGFRPRTLVRDVAALLRPRAAAKGLRLDVSIAPVTPDAVRGDPLRVRQVLLNLVGNAIKFTENGSIRLEISRADAIGENCMLMFRVVDTGIGIAPEAQQRLFKPFTQASSSTSRQYGGTGLGLAISYRLALLMNGSMGVDSEPGRGSTFWFQVPVGFDHTCHEMAAPPEAAPAEPAHTRRPSGRILIADDNPVNRLVALRAVRRLGYEADVAADGNEALNAWQRGGIDLILMDCQMPGMDGFQATAEIRRHEGGARHVPIIAMTANAVEGDDKMCLASGMDGYLPKPVRLSTLAQTLESWLAVAPPPG